MGASYSDSMPFLHRFTSCSKIIDRQGVGLGVTEFSFLILWLKKHMSSKAGRLVQVSVCRADSVSELNRALWGCSVSLPGFSKLPGSLITETSKKGKVEKMGWVGRGGGNVG